MSEKVQSFTEITTSRWSSNDAEDHFVVENPATGEVITTVQGGGPAEMDAAVRAAHDAFQKDWRWRPAPERGALLLECAAVLEEHADELAELLSRENGKPIPDAYVQDVSFPPQVFRFFGDLVDKLPGEFYDKGAIDTSVVYEPLGVVGATPAWRGVRDIFGDFGSAA